jgi:hypothetical protein
MTGWLLVGFIASLVIYLVGWLTWFLDQDNEWQFEVLFNLTFGVFLWPLLWISQGIARR